MNLRVVTPPTIDLRSDTVTRPTRAMRQAMADALVGDDVYGEDPTVYALEEEMAAMLRKEACLFVSSGTMGNQLAIACQTAPGDEVLIGAEAHLAFNEVGAAGALSGVQFRVLGEGGFFSPKDVTDHARPDAYYYPRTTLAAFENTHNRAGGRVLPAELASAVASAAHRIGLACHLDGARLWNASVAAGVSVADLAEPFDTVSVCFSKGLGAPVGSALVGGRDLIRRARRLRKMWGGGMRQVGILAAGARYALAHHMDRLVDDHVHAKLFATELQRHDGVLIDLGAVETNIVNVDVAEPLLASEVADAARVRGVLLGATTPHRLRAVMHLDISRDDAIEGAARVAAAVADLMGK